MNSFRHEKSHQSFPTIKTFLKTLPFLIGIYYLLTILRFDVVISYSPNQEYKVRIANSIRNFFIPATTYIIIQDKNNHPKLQLTINESQASEMREIKYPQFYWSTDSSKVILSAAGYLGSLSDDARILIPKPVLDNGNSLLLMYDFKKEKVWNNLKKSTIVQKKGYEIFNQDNMTDIKWVITDRDNIKTADFDFINQ
jgi:hypothetical protein